MTKSAVNNAFGINIKLEDWQHERATHLLDMAEEAQARGEHGAVFAQVVRTEDGGAAMMLRFLDRQTCRAVQAATGVDENTVMGEDGEITVALKPGSINS